MSTQLTSKNVFKRVWAALRRQTTLDVIDEQLQAAQKALINNQSTADHYGALANGCRATIAHLTQMREAALKGAPTPRKDVAPRPVKGKTTAARGTLVDISKTAASK